MKTSAIIHLKSVKRAEEENTVSAQDTLMLSIKQKGAIGILIKAEIL